MCQLCDAARLPLEEEFEEEEEDEEYGDRVSPGNFQFPATIHVFPAAFIYPLQRESSLLNLGDLLVRDGRLRRGQVTPAPGHVQSVVDRLLSPQ